MLTDLKTAHDPYAPLRQRDFRWYLAGNFVSVLGTQMQTVAVGWEMYERTGSPLALGLVGLTQFLPVVLFVLPAGWAADRFPRRWVIMVTCLVQAMASLGLAWISWGQSHPYWMFASLWLAGTARAFQQPAKTSFVPHLVPLEVFSNAVGWNTGAFHLASVLGPAAGGLVLGVTGRAGWVYLIEAMAAFWFLLVLARLRVRHPERGRAVSSDGWGAGWRYVRRQPVVLGAITLDMFAVLLGGSVALLPIYAKDILRVGPEGLGWMRAAPGLGALLMAAWLAQRPPFRKAGRTLLGCVTGFGVAAIVFGLSRSFPLSLAMLLLAGMLDSVSVVVRHTLVQVLTPDHLRGRVSAINSLFIGASNELGGFESGLVAAWFGPVISVVSGGVGTLIVVAAIAWLNPPLRRFGSLGQVPNNVQAEFAPAKNSLAN
ncbi:MAG: MFS transporter [Pirellulaceae bacterium]|nr:MAG: MFS transporter [Pirellulaceae bacterium]